jgi:hypothetical protein
MATTEHFRTILSRPSASEARRSAQFRSIPDPLSLQLEGSELRRRKKPGKRAVLDWCERALECLSFLAATDPLRTWTWDEQVLPLLLGSDLLRRCREQVRGYPGDYQIMQAIHDARAVSIEPFARAIDAWALSRPYFKAVREGRRRAGELLRKVRDDFAGAPIAVASLGCGPAVEVFELADAPRTVFTLIDSDAAALDHVRRAALSAGIASRVRTVKANVVHMAAQDGGELPGSYAAIYSLGLIEYFPDEVVVRLLDRIHAKLAPSGRLLLSNCRPAHPDALLLERELSWPMTLRSQAELVRLVQRSKFANSAISADTDAHGVQAFVECRKS